MPRHAIFIFTVYLLIFSGPAFAQPPDAELVRQFNEECSSLKMQLATLDPNQLAKSSTQPTQPTQNGTCAAGNNPINKESLYNQIKFKHFGDQYNWLKEELIKHSNSHDKTGSGTERSKKAITQLDELAKRGFPYLDTLNFIGLTALPIFQGLESDKKNYYVPDDIIEDLENGIISLPQAEELSIDFFNQIHVGNLSPCYPMGIVSKPTEADGYMMSPTFFAWHDRIHASNINKAIKSFSTQYPTHVEQMKNLQLDFSRELLTNSSIPGDVRSALSHYYFSITHETNTLWNDPSGQFPDHRLAELQLNGEYFFKINFTNHQILEALHLLKAFLDRHGHPNFQLSRFYTAFLRNEFALHSEQEPMLKALEIYPPETDYDVELLFRVIKNSPDGASRSIIARFFLDRWLKHPPKDTRTQDLCFLKFTRVPLSGKEKIEFLTATLKSSTIDKDVRGDAAFNWSHESPITDQDIAQTPPNVLEEYNRTLTLR